MNCIYCQREIKNKGSLKAHEMSCANNPNKIKHLHSPNAGVKKGTPSPLRGLKKTEKVIQRVVEVVETGKLISYSEPAARRIAKKYLIYMQGNKCSICSTTEWIGNPVPLVCDHISGDSSDNNIENFRLVCCNCDALLPTFKSKNRGKGRTYDREYRQKKSLIVK
jgi:hypothetical protein